MKRIAVAPLKSIRAEGLVQVDAGGIPYCVTMGPDDKPHGFIRICPHRWVKMDPRGNGRVIRCDLHNVVFDGRTGNVLNDCGRYVERGLASVSVVEEAGYAFIDVEPEHRCFVAYCKLRNALQKVGKVFNRLLPI